MEDYKALSLISRDASTAIKGLLMLLIVFGHVGMLTTNFVTGDRTFFWHWLYTFHVYVFLILPFIYGYHRCDVSDVKEGRDKSIGFHCIIKDFKHNLIKIGVPYCWFFVLSVLVYSTVGGGSFNLKGVVYAFLFGNQSLMDRYIGFNFMWFLPAMLALTFVKSLWYNSKSAVRYCMLGLSILLWLLAIINLLSQDAVGNRVPFSLSQAFYYLLLGLVARGLIERFPVKKFIPWVVLTVVVFTAILYYQARLPWAGNINYVVLCRLVLPIAMFLLLYAVRNILAKSVILKYIGHYSFQIYLVHVFVVNVLKIALLRFLPYGVGLGILIYILALLISIGLAIFMTKIHFVNKVFFPKG